MRIDTDTFLDNPSGGIMLKKSLFMALALLPAILFAQNSDPVDQASYTSDQKFALVIGNSNYTGLTPLANPVNDANDITAVLQHLGFTVEKILNGNLEQMEDAVTRLKDKLIAAENSYGFFFYAGHGVQSGGENYLIPVNANIPNENAMRNRAMSVQMVLDELNDARNGLFTSQLISNLATPGMEVTEVFKRTGQDVARVSNNQHMPAFIRFIPLGISPFSGRSAKK